MILFINTFHYRHLKTGTLTNIEYPDNEAFNQGQHFLQG